MKHIFPAILIASAVTWACAADLPVSESTAYGPPELAQALAPLTSECYGGMATCMDKGAGHQGCFEAAVACEVPGMTGPNGKVLCNPQAMQDSGHCQGCSMGSGMGTSAMAQACSHHMAKLIAQVKANQAQKQAASGNGGMGMGGMSGDDKGAGAMGMGGMSGDDKGSDGMGMGGMSGDGKGSGGMGKGGMGMGGMGMGHHDGCTCKPLLDGCLKAGRGAGACMTELADCLASKS